jgi:hypothetical protein
VVVGSLTKKHKKQGFLKQYGVNTAPIPLYAFKCRINSVKLGTTESAEILFLIKVVRYRMTDYLTYKYNNRTLYAERKWLKQ